MARWILLLAAVPFALCALTPAVAAKAPLKRVGGPEDLKGLTVLLASDAGAFITGQIVAVDGGVTAV